MGGGGDALVPLLAAVREDMILVTVGALEDVEGRGLKGLMLLSMLGGGPLRSVEMREAERRSFLTSLRAPVSVLKGASLSGAAARLVPRLGEMISSALAKRGGRWGSTEGGSEG